MTTTATSIATTSYGLETNAGIVTSWLPLTTAFPSISRCADSFYSVVANTVAGWDPGYGIDVNTNVQCQPSQVTSWWRSQPPLFRYSLGPLVCPEAYTTGFTSVKDLLSTFIACCPSGYSIYNTLDAGDTGECISQLTPGQIITFGVKESLGWTTSTETLTQASTAAGIQINGWIFASETSSNSVSTPTLITSSITSTFTSQVSKTTSTSTSQLSIEMPNSGLADAGIGVGISLIILLTAGLSLFIFWRLHRRSRTRIGSISLNHGFPRKLDHESVTAETSELSTNTRSESIGQYHELWTNNR